MKKKALALVILLITGCTATFPRFPSLRQHADPFYNYDDSMAPGSRFPLIDPVQVRRESPSAPWELELANVIWVDLPNRQVDYPYVYVEELGKFSVKDGVIMAYSAYVDKQADPYIQNNYYHWFVTAPDKNITEGFHTEDEFGQYVQSLGIQNLEWQNPDEAFDKYFQTGCLDWIPDCK